MEYKKKDMYLQVESGRPGGWVRVEGTPIPTPQTPVETGASAPPLPATPPEAGIPTTPAAPQPTLPAQPPTQFPARVPAQMPMRAPEQMPMQAPLPQAPAAPPVQDPVQVPESTPACGYCITLGMAYIPVQAWQSLYEPEDGFARGTIFEELDFPFMGKGDCRYD